MRYPARGSRRERTTLCISSQAGCAVGCPFCATGELGLWRDLTPAEIVDQARYWRQQLAAEGRRLTNIVFMGMGEPLLNADAVLAACAALSDGNRFGLGQRHITVSTSGVIPGIERLTALRRAVHAGRVAARRAARAARRARAAQPALPGRTRSCARRRRYAEATGRRVTYEMVMIDGINDTAADARAAAALLRDRLAHVNLIPMNPVAHTPWQPSPPERVEAFASVLRAAGAGHDRAAQPRPRHRRRLRPAGGRAGRRSRRRRRVAAGAREHASQRRQRRARWRVRQPGGVSRAGGASA